MSRWALLWLVCFIGTIYAANWALTEFGFIAIGFGLTAPAGVYFAGLTFTFRDFLRETSTRSAVILAIFIGAGLSFFLEDARRIAIASGVAFLISELADSFVYEPLRARGWTLAVLCSNVVGFTLDSILFLWIAFGSLAFIEGLLVGKAYMTLLAVGIIYIFRAANGRWLGHRGEGEAS